MAKWLCVFILHDWRYRYPAQRTCNRCGKRQLKYPYDPGSWNNPA